MFQYDIGDKVVILPYSSIAQTDVELYFEDKHMPKYCLSVAEITSKKVCHGENVYRLDIDLGDWVWHEQWLISQSELLHRFGLHETLESLYNDDMSTVNIGFTLKELYKMLEVGK